MLYPLRAAPYSKRRGREGKEEKGKKKREGNQF